ncbi:MAG: sigma-70 family RNA polymerase sigma factor [Bacteroidia bacterium]|nr:sigma-70 family RNA polymerase sigma factor [Bacteroidia bacterium]
MQTKNDASVCKEKVFDNVFELHGESLRNFCYYKCGDREEAEDYAQEAFVRLWENCAKVPFQKARGFLFTVAQNLFYKKVEHQKVVLKFIRRQNKRSDKETPEFLQEEKEFLNRLETAISSLSEKQREVFLLNRMDGKSYKEIAAMLDISVKAVEKRMHNALITLRKLSPQI